MARIRDLLSLVCVVASAAACGAAARDSDGNSGAPESSMVTAAQAIWDGTNYVTSSPGERSFTLADSAGAAPIVMSGSDWPGVKRVVEHLRADIARVTTGDPPSLITDKIPSNTKQVIVVGTLGKSDLVDGLVANGKLDVDGVAGKWDTFVMQVVDSPMANVERALVIAGSNKRGTIYGIYDLAAHIGVSPWYYWADVPAPHQPNLYVAAGRFTSGEPKVKYRGIFINDENPALLEWVNATDGGFNREFYGKVFELMLRLRANYLWPAMWGKAFNTDDPENAKLADEYGIIMGTSHHQPMMRAQSEWTNAGHSDDEWNYDADAETIREFWKGGLERMGNDESIVTIGMRGLGDEPLKNASVSLLQQVIADQREIIHQTTGRDASSTPQIWALYKEVQEFYDQGMTVPEDVTLLFADDNYGNLRRLPNPGAPPRAGGYGVYYHYDYVGQPRNYKWLNTNPLPRIWEQLHLAYEHGARKLFIVNVGDIKPMELPLEFFMDYAWDPEAWPVERLPEYAKLWARRQFGANRADEIAEVLNTYAKFNARRKPEFLAPDLFSLTNYREAERIVDDWNALAKQAEAINDALPSEYRDAFFQLVLYPVLACANMTELYVTVGRNALYYRQGRAATNELAKRAKELFAKDGKLTDQYHQLANGKWNHMMSQTHIGYSGWQQPDANVMPEVKELSVPVGAALGVAIEGSEEVWPGSSKTASLPELSPYQPDGTNQYIDLFNRGQSSFGFTATASDAPWLELLPSSGNVDQEQRILVSVKDWTKVPAGRSQVAITITGPNGVRVAVQAKLDKPKLERAQSVAGSVETDGFVSIDAGDATARVDSNEAHWQRIPDFGRYTSGMTLVPTTLPEQIPGGSSPRLEYRIYLHTAGTVSVQAYVAPSLPIHKTHLRYAISLDDDKPQVVDINADSSDEAWGRQVSDNINLSLTRHSVSAAGDHILKFWGVDTNVVLERLVVDAGGLRPSYLGPPATKPQTPRQFASETPSDAPLGNESPASSTESAASGRSNAASGCACRTATAKTASTWFLGGALMTLFVRRRRSRGSST